MSGPVETGDNMLANFSRINESADVDEQVSFFWHVKEAARNFADLGDRFRRATSRNSTLSVLKHDINTVFAVQAGDLLCQCWRRGMFSVYRPHFYFPKEDEPRIRYVFVWFSFVRWHLATTFKNRFRDDWKFEFAPEMDRLKGQDHHSQRDYQSASDDANDFKVWRLNLYADVQATACDILAEELGQLAEAVEQRLRQLPGNFSEGLPQEGNPSDTAGDSQPAATESDDAEGQTWQNVQDELDRLRLRGERYTSQEKLAKKIGCKKFLVHKAIANGTTELQEWAKRPRTTSRLNVTPEAAAVAFDSTPQSREVDPANAIDDDDVDEALDYLLTQAAPHEQARINSMAPAEKRQLAETVYRDPDTEEQVERHRQAKRSRRE